MAQDMSLASSPHAPVGPLPERFQLLEEPLLDPAYTRWKVKDSGTGEELYLQYFSLPASGWPEDLDLQWEALRSCRDSLWLRPQEKIRTDHHGGILYWVPPGRFFNQIRGTLRDEVYLHWLQDALHDLHQLHRRGILHLAQNPFTWIVFQSDEAMGRETMGLSEVSLHLECPLGQGMNLNTAVALAPEVIRGEAVDVRADLYSLGTLLFLQRSPHLFHHLKSFSQWIEAHLNGDLLQWVPEKISPLNEILRQLLQPDSVKRPESVAHLIQHMDPQNPLAHMTTRQFHEWSARRVRARQVTLVANTLDTLMSQGQLALAARLQEGLGDFWGADLEAYQFYFESRLAKLKDQGVSADASRAEARKRAQKDPKLLARLELDEALAMGDSQESGLVMAHLQKALAAANQTQDTSLKVQILLERGRAQRALGSDAAALKELKLAYDRLPQVELQGVRSAVLGELADGLQAYGFYRQATPMLALALEAEESEPMARALRLLQGALGAMFRKEWDQAKEFFREARHLISAQKDLATLIWAMGHEVRLSIAQENWEQVRRELKALRIRNRDLGFQQALLALLELQLTLATQRSLSAHPEKLYASLDELVKGARSGKTFQDLSWSPAQTTGLLAKYLKWRGRLGEAREMEKLRDQAQARGRSACLALGFSEELPLKKTSDWVAMEGKKSETPAQPSEPKLDDRLKLRQERYLQEQIRSLEASKAQLLEENLNLNREIQALKEQLERLLAIQPVTSPSPPAPSPKPESQAKVTPSPEAMPKPQAKTPPSPDVSSQGEAPESKAHPKPRVSRDAPLTQDVPGDQDERERLITVLKKHQGHRSRAAKELGIHRRTILEKIKRHGLEQMDFLPDVTQMQKALDEAGGNRSKAAKKLGMSRTSFYRRLKELSLDTN